MEIDTEGFVNLIEEKGRHLLAQIIEGFPYGKALKRGFQFHFPITSGDVENIIHHDSLLSIIAV